MSHLICSTYIFILFIEVTSIRSGLRKRKRPESPQSTEPQVTEEWVDEDKLELWEIKQYGDRYITINTCCAYLVTKIICMLFCVTDVCEILSLKCSYYAVAMPWTDFVGSTRILIQRILNDK